MGSMFAGTIVWIFFSEDDLVDLRGSKFLRLGVVGAYTTFIIFFFYKSSVVVWYGDCLIFFGHLHCKTVC